MNKQKCVACENDAVCLARGMPLCSKHRSQWYRHKRFDDNTIYVPNKYIMCDDHAEIVIKNSRCIEVGRAIIDLEDVEKCKPYKWHLNNHGYVVATIPNGTKTSKEKLLIHRLVLDYKNYDMVIDHINRNPLDNRKENLRIVPQFVNTANNGASGVIRVPSGRYQAHVTRHYQNIYIGTYDTYDEAVAARKAFVAEYDRNDLVRHKEVG